jgi:plastocyanin
MKNVVRNAISNTLLAIVTAFALSSAHGADLTVEIRDARGRPVPDAVVVATVSGTTHPGIPSAPKPAVMDQVDKAFVPAVLIVRTGTPVVFPNSDTVAHQVYSFSPAKRFELPLYRGQAHPPIAFDRPGLVVLGCNIHDTMVGYIYVTDSPWFGKSDERGVLTLSSLPPADYEVTLWSPRLPRADTTVMQSVNVKDLTPALVRFHLQQVLRPDASPRLDARIRDY